MYNFIIEDTFLSNQARTQVNMFLIVLLSESLKAVVRVENNGLGGNKAGLTSLNTSANSLYPSLLKASMSKSITVRQKGSQ